MNKRIFGLGLTFLAFVQHAMVIILFGRPVARAAVGLDFTLHLIESCINFVNVIDDQRLEKSRLLG